MEDEEEGRAEGRDEEERESREKEDSILVDLGNKEVMFDSSAEGSE